ncbi:MAG: TraR/DksA family transcriptional regulator [Myxococcota bacterium]
MDQDRFRGLLEAKAEELAAQIEEGREAAKPVELDQSRVGRLSRMDAMQEQAMSAESQRRRKLHLTRVKTALARLEEGSYGDCLDCGEPISEKRLLHDPAATLCIECARAR